MGPVSVVVNLCGPGDADLGRLDVDGKLDRDGAGPPTDLRERDRHHLIDTALRLRGFAGSENIGLPNQQVAKMTAAGKSARHAECGHGLGGEGRGARRSC